MGSSRWRQIKGAKVKWWEICYCVLSGKEFEVSEHGFASQFC